jgi:hypothetical protein
MTREKPDTVPAASDVQSDPGKGAEDRSDWADEGGATTKGPASDTEDN